METEVQSHCLDSGHAVSLLVPHTSLGQNEHKGFQPLPWQAYDSPLWLWVSDSILLDPQINCYLFPRLHYSCRILGIWCHKYQTIYNLSSFSSGNVVLFQTCCCLKDRCWIMWTKWSDTRQLLPRVEVLQSHIFSPSNILVWGGSVHLLFSISTATVSSCWSPSFYFYHLHFITPQQLEWSLRT